LARVQLDPKAFRLRVATVLSGTSSFLVRHK
jgi:hypothetical protein